MTQHNPLNHARPPMKACADLLRKAAYRHPLHQVFADFVEMSALSLSNAVDLRQREKREARYMEIVRRYEKHEAALFPQMLACVVDALDEEPHDFLGQLFMSLELGNHWKGQFFTPGAVAELMARINLAGLTAEDIAQRGGFITVSEPACGAGAMVIAMSKAMTDLRLNYQQLMHVTAQDLDSTAVHMSFVQASLLHIPAIVIQGNTLTLEEREHWFTPAHILGGWDFKLARRMRAAAAAVPAQPVRPSPPALADETEPIFEDILASQRNAIVADRAGQLALF